MRVSNSISNDHKYQTKILVVDDKKENLLALRAILPETEYNVITATSGEEALLLLLKHDFAVILLDVMMPGMDGYELARLIRSRERNRHVPIIFLTAVATDSEHIHKGYSLGAADYLMKPLEPEIVKSKVNVFIDLYEKTLQVKKQEELIREKERLEKEIELAELRQAQEERYRLLAESIPQMVWTSRPDGKHEYFNSRWIDYTGLVPNHTDHWLDPIHPEDRERIESGWQISLNEKQLFEAECRVRRISDQSYRWQLVRAVPMRDSSDQVVSWVGTFTDIEDQKRAETELKNTIRSRDEFFSIASHELKTPLTSLKLRADIFDREIRKSKGDMIRKESVIEALEFFNSQLFRLESLVENLLDISRIRLKRFEIKIQKIDLASIARETANRLKDQAAMAGSRIDLNVPQKLEGYWDRMRMEQLLTNLLSNAIRYGNGQPISLDLFEEGKNIKLIVEDRGIGISDKARERIFEPFEREVSLSKGAGGLGLGLFIVKQIVEAHRGAVRAEKREGEGTRFIVELPRGPVHHKKVVEQKIEDSQEIEVSGV